MRWKEEVFRKAIHLGTLLIPLLYLFVTRKWALSIVVPLAALSLVIDIARLGGIRASRVFLRLFGALLREHERQTLTGASYLVVSSSLCILFYDKPVAILSVLFLVLGDPVAALVGGRYGRTQIWGRKSIEGSLACFIVCLAVTAFIPGFALWPKSPTISMSARLLGPLTATLVEGLPVPVDDNLSVPLVSGLVMQALV